MVVRGVPHRLARDGWWLDDSDPTQGLRAAPLLFVALVLADTLMWGFRPGVGVAVWMLLLAVTVAMTVYRNMTMNHGLIAGLVLLVAVAPLLEVVQFGTVVIAIIGLILSGVIICTSKFEVDVLMRALARFPGYGLMQNLRDALAVRLNLPSKGGFWQIVSDWAFPVIVGGIFTVLFVAANPLVDRWFAAIVRFDPDFLPSGPRVFFWCFIAVAIWPLLRLSTLMPKLAKPKVRAKELPQSGFVNARSVSRALITFNLIFAMQTLLDVGYLWSGAALPEGMTYAEYAHRGAYPLLATAILAGIFALVAQPYLGEGKFLRTLLYLWIGQTVLLVISSILRLDLYVDVYGLTRLRFAAFVWMIVVALGLVLIVMQMVGQQTVKWFLQRALGLGLLSIYLCNLTNIDGLIARHNLATVEHDAFYLCQLSEGAVPAIRAYEARTGQEICYSYRPYLSQRDDWREWGYRNARLHRSLAALEAAQ